MEASPNPLFRAHETGGSEAPRDEGRLEPPRDITAVKRGKSKATGHLDGKPKKRRPALAQEAQRPLPRLRREERAVGAAPVTVAVALLQTDTAVVPVRAKRAAVVSRPRVPSPPPPSPTPVGSPRPPVARKAAGRVIIKEEAAKKVAVKRPVAKSREDRRGLSNFSGV